MANYTIILINKATKKYILLQMADRSESTRFYTFRVAGLYEPIVEAIGTGEGEYYVCPAGTTSPDGATILDRGVLQIGKIARTDTDTYNTTKTYEQYGG